MSPKFVTHNQSGLDIRVAPYVYSLPEHEKKLALDMIASSPVVGCRGEKDCLPHNLEMNIRLRKSAHEIANLLEEFAQSMKVDRYAVVVHGSLARGLVRHQESDDPSDVDIDLIIGDPYTIDKTQKHGLRMALFDASSHFRTRIDSYTFDMRDIRENVGCYARNYLASSSYMLKNQGMVWEEIVHVGMETAQFLRFTDKERRIIRRSLKTVSANENDEFVMADSLRIHSRLQTYINRLVGQDPRVMHAKAMYYNQIFNNQNGNQISD